MTPGPLYFYSNRHEQHEAAGSTTVRCVALATVTTFSCGGQSALMLHTYRKGNTPVSVRAHVALQVHVSLIAVGARSNSWVCVLSFDGIVDSNRTGSADVGPLRVLCFVR